MKANSSSEFDKFAQSYDKWYERPFGRSAFELEVECLKRILSDFKKGLEIGVGTGRFASALKVEFGIDPSLQMLKYAVQRGIKAVLGVGENLPFKSSTFDLVLVVVTICFVESPDKVVKEARRVLKKDGSLVLGLITSESPWAQFYKKKALQGHPIYKLAKFYSFSEVEKILSENGFEIVEIKSTLFEKPQDKFPVKVRKIKDGFSPEAGFLCVRTKLK